MTACKTIAVRAHPTRAGVFTVETTVTTETGDVAIVAEICRSRSDALGRAAEIIQQRAGLDDCSCGAPEQEPDAIANTKLEHRFLRTGSDGANTAKFGVSATKTRQPSE